MRSIDAHSDPASQAHPVSPFTAALRGAWRHRRAWGPAAWLSLLILLLYAPSIRYGLIWDDPSWYWKSTGPSLWQTLTSLSSFQFYRPLTILMNRSLVSSSGVVHVRLAHAIQIVAHTLVTVTSIPALRILGFSRRAATLSALTIAVHPYAFQAVAWQAPQQPITMALVLLSFLSAERYLRGGKGGLLILSALLYALALLMQESSVPWALLFAWLLARRWRDVQGTGRRYGMLAHLALAGAFVALWLLAPKREGVTGGGLQLKVLLYLVQGIVYPLARGIAALGLDLPLPVLGALYFGAWLVLVVLPWRADRGRSGLVAAILILLGMAPVWIGLSWAYVKIGSRLLYPALLGVGALWGRLIAWMESRSRGLRGAGYAITLVLLLMSVSQWARFTRLYDAGTQHLAEAVDVMAAEPDRSLLFVNYPDRLEMRPKLYPLGYWGLTLAPGTQPFSDYALAAYGRSAEARCFASFANGATMRESWPYRVDMRGVGLQAEGLFEQAKETDAVYISKYEPGGTLALRYVGSLGPEDGRPAAASFGERVELVDATVTPAVVGDAGLDVDLVWRPLVSLHPEDTLFLHVLRSDGHYMQGRDGDPVGALLPMRTWSTGWLVTDRREVPLEGLPPGDYLVTVGIYNRASGERYAAILADGQPVPGDELPVHAFSLP